MLDQKEILRSETEESQIFESDPGEENDMTSKNTSAEASRSANWVFLDTGTPLVHNTTDDASLLPDILEEAKNRLEKLIGGRGSTFVPVAPPMWTLERYSKGNIVKNAATKLWRRTIIQRG